MKIMEKIGNLLHSESKKWNALKKGDKLYLMIPELKDNIISYNYQESEVIAIKEYNSICNLRFKYTDNGKRKRVNLAINKLKYELPYLAVKKNTQWAHEYIPAYGDIIISFTSAESLNDIYTKLVSNEIEKQEQIIEEHKKILNILRTVQYGKIV